VGDGWWDTELAPVQRAKSFAFCLDVTFITFCSHFSSESRPCCQRVCGKKQGKWGWLCVGPRESGKYCLSDAWRCQPQKPEIAKTACEKHKHCMNGLLDVGCRAQL